MAKYLLLLLVIMVVSWGLFGRRRGSRHDGPPPAGRPAPREDASQIDDMVACAHCGVHLPRGEAVAEEGRGGRLHYCSQEHQRRGPGSPSGS